MPAKVLPFNYRYVRARGKSLRVRRTPFNWLVGLGAGAILLGLGASLEAWRGKR